MAVYSTLFTAADTEIVACFPDARRRLATPVTRSGSNPFTGEATEYTTWDPGAPEGTAPTTLAGPQGRPAVDPVEPADTDYAKYLEANAPPFVRTFPHVALKSVDPGDIAEALGVEDPPEWFFDCPDDEGCVVGLPRQALRRISTMGEDERREFAAEWATQSSWLSDPGDCDHVLRLIQRLAHGVGDDAHLFSHMLP
ncbi:hypothetical protein Mal64_05700 [Pseudobythopirellula maris]|uniref:Uncharacterized protein n=1 Tax=Pseudobythopirellula maris TaxID=2527991 RepID=A0A5C5ZSH6_9BACT|nr:hypothetical protein [Pseudobythopirellula maris]TWT90186.1 hypothetical protein Mal64_05700 [Pseudobythopirellula maris]